MNSYKKQSGAILLEALIGMLIFAIGVLGLVGMQAASIQNSAAATYRAEASYLANQILSVMWADKDNLTAYALNAGNAVCAAGASNSNKTELSSWLSNDLASKLPGSVAAASGVTGLQQQIAIGANNLVTVTLCWQAPKELTPHKFEAVAQIN